MAALEEEKVPEEPIIRKRYNDVLADSQRQVQLARQTTSHNSSFELSPIYYSESETMPTKCKIVVAVALMVISLSLISVGLHFKNTSAAYSFFFLLLGIAALIPGAYFSYMSIRDWASTPSVETQAMFTGPRSSVA